MLFKKDFFEQIDQFTSAPILFVGSGFSLRYLGTENWENLLRLFSDQLGVPFEKYKSKANGHWPKVGTLIAEDYHNYWFSKDELKNTAKHEMVEMSSPLKVAISDHVTIASNRSIGDALQKEIELLKEAKINGVITTNYDRLIEKIFPQFRVFKSQKELIFSTLQEVGEIYKIHGCCTEPNSLILTEEDYTRFLDQNPYLAAKLLTTFLEHPTLFIGYSISDENIRNILKSVVNCLDSNQINEIAKRLFFIEYDETISSEPTIERSEIEIGDNRIPLTRIKANSYEPIYEVLTELNQKIPAAVLRRIKEHIYELVVTNDPSEKLRVVDFDNETDLDKVDVVIGVGIEANKKLGKSYDTYGRFDIAKDVLAEEYNLDSEELCFKTLPKLCKVGAWIPVWKYLKKCETLGELSPKVLKASTRPLEDWKKGNTYSYQEKQLNEANASISDILQSTPAERALLLIPLLDIEKIEVNDLRNFLVENKALLENQAYTSHYMKLVCLYDRLVYGNN